MLGLTMSAVAERAGVSRPTLYKYFPDIGHVLATWVGEEIDAFIDEHLGVEAEGGRTPTASIEQFIRAQLAEFASHPQRLGLTHLEAGVPSAVLSAVHARMDLIHTHLVRILREGVAEGAFAADLDAELQALLLTNVLGALRATVADPSRDSADVADAVVALLLDGLRARPVAD